MLKNLAERVPAEPPTPWPTSRHTARICELADFRAALHPEAHGFNHERCPCRCPETGGVINSLQAHTRLSGLRCPRAFWTPSAVDELGQLGQLGTHAVVSGHAVSRPGRNGNDHTPSGPSSSTSEQFLRSQCTRISRYAHRPSRADLSNPPCSSRHPLTQTSLQH